MNDLRSCILYNPRAVLQRLLTIKVLATLRVTMVSVIITTSENELQQSINIMSTEHQQSWVLHLV